MRALKCATPHVFVQVRGGMVGWELILIAVSVSTSYLDDKHEQLVHCSIAVVVLVPVCPCL